MGMGFFFFFFDPYFGYGFYFDPYLLEVGFGRENIFYGMFD
jgi:hypothetical protein